MSNSVVLIILLQIISIAKAQSKSVFYEYYVASGDDSCETVLNEIYVNGRCSTIDNCPSVLFNTINQIYDHTLCGYIDRIPFVCCPIELRPLEYQQIGNSTKLVRPKDQHSTRSWILANDKKQAPKKAAFDRYQYLECNMENSNEIGVIKFASECPELNVFDSVADHFNKLCDYEICADLVCCPVQYKHRLKKVCPKVDDPTETLRLRLLRNQECTIKELNMKGKYQRSCDFAERNPHLVPLLQNVCNFTECNGWYCCPIEVCDKFRCTEREISASIAIFVGPKCIDSRSGRSGTCKSDWDCIWHPSTMDKCGTHCSVNYYCCPDDVLVSLSVSAQACLSYTNYLQKEVIQVPMDSDTSKPSCPTFTVSGIFEGGIGGGSIGAGPFGGAISFGIPASPGDFPQMAALGYESKGNEISWRCGGSLISERYVLTAAHCISIRSGRVKKVRLGATDLLNNVWDTDCPEEYDVVRQIPYPEYTPRLVYNDIGLIELDGHVKFNFHIRPLCLPISSDIPEDFTAMGWGAYESLSNKNNSYLLQIDQTLFSHEECNRYYKENDNRKINKGILNETQICAGSRYSKQSTCTGSSGGPLLGYHSRYQRTFNIYGIVSFGTTCGFANTPGIYTKVYPYVKWIEGIVWNNY